MLRDSRAKVLFVSSALLPALETVVEDVPTLRKVIVSHAPGGFGSNGVTPRS